MAYPTSIISFTTKNTGDIIQAGDVNTLQTEVVSIETGLLNGLQHTTFPLTDVSKDLGKTVNRWQNIYSSALYALDIAARVNYLEVDASATGNAVVVKSTGSDATVNLQLGTKGGKQLLFVDVASLVNYLQYAGSATGTDPTLSLLGDATRNLILSLPGTAALLPRADVVTSFGSATLGYSKLYLRGTAGVIRFDDTTIMGMTEKVGSGAGNYTTTGAAYADVDTTNLSFTVTIPTGWKCRCDCVGNAFIGTAGTVVMALTDVTTVLHESELDFTASMLNSSIAFAVSKVFTGDGASHTFRLRWKTTAGTATMNNGSATLAPRMTFILMPSN